MTCQYSQSIIQSSEKKIIIYYDLLRVMKSSIIFFYAYAQYLSFLIDKLEKNSVRVYSKKLKQYHCWKFSEVCYSTAKECYVPQSFETLQMKFRNDISKAMLPLTLQSDSYKIETTTGKFSNCKTNNNFLFWTHLVHDSVSTIGKTKTFWSIHNSQDVLHKQSQYTVHGKDVHVGD